MIVRPDRGRRDRASCSPPSASAVVRANLRPLNDIELTAGQIAAGHLDHRVPEGDPRTEIGSLGRSLNAMLTQIERPSTRRRQSEQAAHQSEERMRRFIADASHELRTPLTTIRGFAAHYRQRGGASSLRTGAPATQELVIRERMRLPPRAADHSAWRRGLHRDGLSPEDLDHLMGRVESEATRMGLLVEDLLTLATARPAAAAQPRPRSTCSRWPPTRCRTRGSSPPGGRST